ncbi:4Fe-4S ferredoxin iron-sulfur binding domain protein [Chondrocystis sp. NIES-4102]|nr:4Fe-4S ferredoxin iron-sulfur binding domain protein [Chondrocystis sp. NIES-4102]
MRVQSIPLTSLIEGSWFKLICGASYQHLPAVRNLALIYSLAGADCIDVAADPAVIAAAQEGINIAAKLSKNTISSPWLMVSINDAEDPHFRKAEFDITQCPSDCPQPCVQVCPAEAINLNSLGVIDSLCYGCGRCIPICPQGLINTRSHISSPSVILPAIELMGIDAIEIHTQVGHEADFQRLWLDIMPVIGRLKLLAISCTDHPQVIEYLRSLYEIINPLPCPLIWQTDGRSMSGDIGKGTTHAAVAFAQKVLQAKLPGYVQLAGGTNDYTVKKLKTAGMLRQAKTYSICNTISGVAYGSYARAILSPILNQLETTQLQNIKFNLNDNKPMNQLNLKLEDHQQLLEAAVNTASGLVKPIKNSSIAQ